ncbi:Polycomb complex protein BMI-1 [Amphibalanus amphitrite]|uniref:Polycomb complex protein BMI-1 n=1 Tax=Amphibalanus amphitrite TaxID=1232801 RepID=A0A6A4WDM7_AMPAM|nr:Polycomb complex protein BMI-1 [Amphibalanus amphitrite]
MKMRRDFYDMKPYADPELPSWAKGDVASYVPHVFTPDESLQLRLAMFDAESRDDEESRQQRSTSGVPPVRYLRCQAGTPLTVLQKLIRNKFQLPPNVQVQLIHGRHVLPDDISLMDVGYLHRPPQDAPVRLEYRLVRKRPAPSVTHAETAAVSQDTKPAKTIPPPKQKQQPTFHEPNPASFHFPAGMVPHDFYSSPLHVNTSMASRLSYDMAMRNLLTLSHMAMAQGGMVRPPSHMFPTHPMFPPLPKGHEFHPMSDPSLLRRQSEARMGASAKKASPTAGTTAPPLRTPTALTSASIQHMENLTRTVGKSRSDPERHSVTLTPIPPK